MKSVFSLIRHSSWIALDLSMPPREEAGYTGQKKSDSGEFEKGIADPLEHLGQLRTSVCHAQGSLRLRRDIIRALGDR